MRCAVYSCSNNNDKKDKRFRFYSFPKEKQLLKQWVNFCRRKDNFNTKTARICCRHFTSDDFERNLQYEMGLCKQNGYKLKNGIVPTLNRTSDSSPGTSEQRSNRLQVRENQKFVRSVLTHSENIPIPQVEVSVEDAESEKAVSCNDAKEKIKKLEEILQLKVHDLEKENFLLKEDAKERSAELESLNQKLIKTEFEMTNMEVRLNQIFTCGQVNKLKRGEKKLHWTESDIAHSITLYSASPRAYKLLRRKNFPLPGVRTLQDWAHKVDISPGILQPVVKIMTAANQLSDIEKVCVLSFDEMKIKKKYCYNRSSDSTLAPADYVQVVMLRGLFMKWKQPIFYQYDCQMTKTLLFNILDSTKACGYNVVAIVSDLGGGNRGLHTELQIEPDKPWFVYDSNKIFAFADVPHLIKLLRNHFVDSGFVINNRQVKKEIVLELLSCTSSELSITHKISSNHLNVHGADRQKVKLATKLFSHTVAQSLTRAGSLGLMSDTNWKECSEFFKIVNDWFDVMNVRAPTEDSRERTHGYGLALECQNNILSAMTEMVREMRVIDREEFKYRLRAYILGYNQGVLSDNSNTAVDDTPDLEDLNYSLTGTIFKTISASSKRCENENITIERCDHLEEGEINLMAYDGLENLAGYICHKLKGEVPNIRVAPENDNSYTWVNHLSEGGLSKPTKDMMIHMTALEAIFKEINGEDILITTDYIKQHLAMASNINSDVKVKKLFFRSRMYFRIRKLNKEIAENAMKRKRKYKKITN